ncbi:MAG: hypothetical protein JXB06_15420 [Spirochaetales bacterium]|nr:hypothetical protein [Spirochaetales bacterium]
MLLRAFDGVTFLQAWKGKENTRLEVLDKPIEVYIIGLDHLIKNKEAIKRNKDLDDLRYLRAVQKERKNDEA